MRDGDEVVLCPGDRVLCPADGGHIPATVRRPAVTGVGYYVLRLDRPPRPGWSRDAVAHWSELLRESDRRPYAPPVKPAAPRRRGWWWRLLGLGG